MKLIRGSEVVDIENPNIIPAFLEAGYVEAPEAEEVTEAPKKKTTKANK